MYNPNENQGPKFFCFLRDKNFQNFSSLLWNSIIRERWLCFVLWVQTLLEIYKSQPMHIIVYILSAVLFVVSLWLRRLFLRKIRTDSREFIALRNVFNYQLPEKADKQ